MKAADYQSKINHLEAQIVQRDQEIAKRDEAIIGHEAHIKRLRQVIAKRYAQGAAAGIASVKKPNIWGADMDALKAECIRRTAAGEAVVISGGKVVLKADLYKKAA